VLSYPLGGKFSVRPFILLNSREYSTTWVNEGVNIHTRGQISPLVAKFTPRGEVRPLWARGEVKNGALIFITLTAGMAVKQTPDGECEERTYVNGKLSGQATVIYPDSSKEIRNYQVHTGWML
jgi:hypothetical protein